MFMNWKIKAGGFSGLFMQAEAQASESNAGQAVMSIEEVNYLKNDIAFDYSRTYYFRKGFTAYFHIGDYLR